MVGSHCDGNGNMCSKSCEHLHLLPINKSMRLPLQCERILMPGSRETGEPEYTEWKQRFKWKI